MFWCKKYEERIEELKYTVSLMKEQYTVLANKAVKLEVALIEAKKASPRRKYRRRHRKATGYTKVSEGESLEIYNMYKRGLSLTEIANTVGRSNSCVSRHVDKHIEENKPDDEG